MHITIRAFGIARDILNSRKMAYELDSDRHTIADLKTILQGQYSDFEKLAKLSFAVNEEYVDDSYLLQEDDEVVLIPPVSGG
jgi:molybdopterin converting factor subunit 1